MKQIPFNQPYLSSNALKYIKEVFNNKKASGNGPYTRMCHSFFEQRYGFQKCLLTTSCTDALEMAALLINIESGDEVIMPSYTFVSTANPFLLRGGKIRFADSLPNNPNVNPDKIEQLITSKTKAIVITHYAGIACDMNRIMFLAERHDLFVIEDAAQGIDSFYKSKPLGSIGHLAAMSFHETKNIQCGEGGMLIINDPDLNEKAEIIWEKGTNRAAFFRGEIEKYEWVDVGSSFLPSEILAAMLYSQLEEIDSIQQKRVQIWNRYYDALSNIKNTHQFSLPIVPSYASTNGHLFYLVLRTSDCQKKMISYLNEKGINSVFHYQSLHKSNYFRRLHDERDLPNSDKYSDCLVRLPFYFELDRASQDFILSTIASFFDR